MFKFATVATLVAAAAANPSNFPQQSFFPQGKQVVAGASTTSQRTPAAPVAATPRVQAAQQYFPQTSFVAPRFQAAQQYYPQFNNAGAKPPAPVAQPAAATVAQPAAATVARPAVATVAQVRQPTVGFQSYAQPQFGSYSPYMPLASTVVGASYVPYTANTVAADTPLVSQVAAAVLPPLVSQVAAAVLPPLVSQVAAAFPTVSTVPAAVALPYVSSNAVNLPYVPSANSTKLIAASPVTTLPYKNGTVDTSALPILTTNANTLPFVRNADGSITIDVSSLPTFVTYGAITYTSSRTTPMVASTVSNTAAAPVVAAVPQVSAAGGL